MGRRVLISTFGFDEEKVVRALRWIRYDRLVLLADRESLRRPGFRRIEGAERAAGGDVEVVRVDAFGFLDCFEKARRTIERHRRRGDDVVVNVSGGTKVLADATLLACFESGAEVYHCEERPQRLPILRGVTFSEYLTETQRAVLRALDRPRSVSAVVDRLARAGRSDASIHSAITWLKGQGLIALSLREGGAVAGIAPGTAWFVRALL